MRTYFLSVVFILLIPALLHAQDKENSEFKLALNLYNDGMYDLAVEQFKNFTNAYPNTSNGIEARFYLGNTQMKLKRYDEARITFQNFALAYVDHPKAPEAWLNVGEAFLALGNEREAASAFERVKVFHAKSPLAPEALLKAAQLYRRTGERESAKKVLRTIVQDYPGSNSVLPARLAIGEMYAEEGQTELAEREARRVSESNVPAPVKASALYAIGKLQATSSLFDDAEETFTSVITSYKNTPAATASAFELGTLAMSAKNYSAAIDFFKKVSGEDDAEDSLQAKALFAMGEAYSGLKDYSNAQKSLEKLLSKFPKNRLRDEATLEAGRAASANGNYKAAIQYFRKIIDQQSSPLRSKALVFAGNLTATKQQYTDAAKFYSTYLNDYDDDAYTGDAVFKLGDIYKNRLQDYRKAIIVFDQFVQKNSQSWVVVWAMNEMAQCQISLKDYEGALETSQNALKEFPGNDSHDHMRYRISILQNDKMKNRDAGLSKLARLIGEVVTQKSKAKLSFQLGMIYFNDLRDYPSAAEQFTAAIDAGLDEKEFAEAYFNRARALHSANEYDTLNLDQAIIYYDAFLKQFPRHFLSADAAYYSFMLKSFKKSPEDIILIGKDFIRDYPSSTHIDTVLYTIGNLKGAGEKDKIAAFSELILKFPRSPLFGRALLQRGRLYFKTNHADSAADDWQNAASLNSVDESTPGAIKLLADLRWSQKKYPEAISLWERSTTEFFYTSRVSYVTNLLADGYVAIGDYDGAISIYENMYNYNRENPFATPKGDDVFRLHSTSPPFFDPNDNTILFKLADTFEKKGDRQRAIQFYQKYLNRDRKGLKASSAFYALGVLARAQGKTSIASAYFKQAGTLGGTGSATSDIADLLFQTEQYPEAAKQYAQLAQASDSTNKRQYYAARSIVSKLRADQLSEAQKLITVFEKTYGKHKEAQAEFAYEQGSYYYRKQDYTSAKKIFEKVADDYDDTRFGAWGDYYLGKILEVNNKLDDAAKKYDKILKEYPKSDVIARVLLSLGNMHFNAERFEDAIRYYQLIMDVPEAAGDILPYAMNNLIEAYQSTKLYDAALKTTKDFIERYPSDESIIDKKIKIGTLYTKIGYYDQAIVHFQNLIDEAGSLLEAEIRYNIGEAYYNKGDFQQAILEFLKVPYLVSKQGKVNWTATSFYMAGQSYEKMSKFDEAVGMYQQVVDRPGIDATFKAAAKKEIDRVKFHIKKGSK